ncbi:MAG: 2-dehydropantoate 2-reductase [Thermoplasmata archaeon]|nr:2-dehydropantoate 2-reductase [Thermoplasmata archaeon]MCI4354252.1 2-dehydropantoate 2-reductase [Thermoplasmata archaeon]
MADPVRVVVFGAGAVGSFLGAKIASGSHSVLLVGRADHVAAINASGLQVEGRTEGTFRLTARTELARSDRPELLLLTVKSPDVAAAGAAIASTVPGPTPIVALENGLGIERTLIDALRASGWPAPETAVVRAINSYGVTLLGPGRIRHAGDGEILLPKSGAPFPADTLDAVEQLLGDGGLSVRRVPEFEREVWRKALVNAAINPVTADQGLENGALAREPYRRQSEHLLREAQSVARAEGFEFSNEEADRELWKVVRATAPNRSSMLQDLDRGRRTEIAAISGVLLDLGARHGLDLPHTHRAIERIRRREAEGPSRSLRDGPPGGVVP